MRGSLIDLMGRKKRPVCSVYALRYWDGTVQMQKRTYYVNAPSTSRASELKAAGLQGLVCDVEVILQLWRNLYILHLRVGYQSSKPRLQKWPEW